MMEGTAVEEEGVTDIFSEYSLVSEVILAVENSRILVHFYVMKEFKEERAGRGSLIS